MGENEDPYEDFYERARKGAKTGEKLVSTEELAFLVGELQRTTNWEEQLVLIEILGYAGGPSYKGVLEPFLLSLNATLACAALWELCEHWNLTSRYTEQVATFMHGTPEDPLGSCQMRAIGIAGNYLLDHSDPGLLGELISLVEGAATNKETAYHALHALYHLMKYPNVPEAVALEMARARLDREKDEAEAQ